MVGRDAVPAGGGCEGGPSGRDAETRAALALAAAPGLGPTRIRRLVDRYGSARAALRAAGSDSSCGQGLPDVRVGAGGLRPAPTARLREIRGKGIRIVTYGSAGYPTRLVHLHDPPPVLYLRGPLEPPDGRVVAIVGTRLATEYGRRVAYRLAAELAAAGCTVVSGLARGIDAEAHRGALEGGATIGVLGSGLDHVFPAASRPLFRAMARRGLLLSEFEPERRPAAGHFPRRNRIIAALADAVVVVQAGSRSGALITVDHALDLGRDVFAVPGPVDLPASEGTNALLKEGARPATAADDVLAALGPADGAPAARPTHGARPAEGAEVGYAEDGAEAALLAALRGGVESVDELAAAAGLRIGPALAALGRLEVRGAIRSLPGGRFLPDGGWA